MRVGVRGNFEKRIIQKLTIFGGIGVERLAQHEKCCRHLESSVDLYDLTARRQTVRRLSIVSCDVTSFLLPGVPDIRLTGHDARPNPA